MLVVFDRFDYWQVGYVFPKGQYQELRAAGLEQFRRSIVELESRFAEHVLGIRNRRVFGVAPDRGLYFSGFLCTSLSRSARRMRWIWFRAWTAQGPVVSSFTYARQCCSALRGALTFS